MSDYSINTGVIKSFGVVDYVMFASCVVISAGIGMFFAIKGRSNNTTEDFLLAGRQMDAVPVSLSLLVTYLSALTLLGTPVEMYTYNTMFWWLCVGIAWAILSATRITVPFFYNLGVTSVFEYLEMRFGRAVRVIGAVMFILQTLIYLSLALYAPCLAVSTVTGSSLWGSVFGLGVAVTLYTAFGGMKAVVWTDAFQAVIILVGVLAVLIKGSLVVGGVGAAWSIAKNRSRIDFDNFDVNPSTRHSFWSLVIGGGFFGLSVYGVNQIQVQRAVSCPSLKVAQQAMIGNVPGIVLTITMICVLGIVMFAFYADCHPVGLKNLISKSDQLLPLFVMDILSDTPGLPGVFVSSLVSASLSSISSGLNALSAVIPLDLLQPGCSFSISDKTLTIISKCTVLVCGLATIGLAYVVSLMGMMQQVSFVTYAILNGPLFGVFVLGMIFPWANKIGALVGLLVTTVFMFWIGIGAILSKAATSLKSAVFRHGCGFNITTQSQIPLNMTEETRALRDPFYNMYTMSYMYYTVTAMTALIIIGLAISWLTGAQRTDKLDPRLICPLFDALFPCLPESILKHLRFGVQHKSRKIPLVDQGKSTDIRDTKQEEENDQLV